MQTVILAVCIFIRIIGIILKILVSLAKKELDRLIPLPAKQEGVTEQLKAKNQLKWVGLMDNIKAQVEEIIYAEIVYMKNKYD